VVQAALRVDGKELVAKPVKPGDNEITFTTSLDTGSHQLAPVFIDAAGNEIGVYYTVVAKQE
jgi:hypothetical protein